jgi:hypothetical protein
VELQPAGRPQLSFPQIRELHGRFFACALAELEAKFLLGDFGQWHHRHGVIVGQLANLDGQDVAALLRCRVDALGLVPPGELQALQEQAVVTRDACRENQQRIETAVEEVRWVERRELEPGSTCKPCGARPTRASSCCPKTAERAEGFSGQGRPGGSEVLLWACLPCAPAAKEERGDPPGTRKPCPCGPSHGRGEVAGPAVATPTNLRGGCAVPRLAGGTATW